jgi:hypothetical protein
MTKLLYLATQTNANFYVATQINANYSRLYYSMLQRKPTRNSMLRREFKFDVTHNYPTCNHDEIRNKLLVVRTLLLYVATRISTL